MKLPVLLAGVAVFLRAADVPAAMQASLEQQRAAVVTQRESLAKQWRSAERSDFFTVPWTGSGAAATPACDALSKEQIDAMIQAAAKREDLTPDLLRAVINQESGFRPCAVSPKGAMGLMQLMPATVEQFKVADAFDPQQNIDTGAKFLKELVTRYGGDISLALSAYNSGPARVDSAGGVPAIAETMQYVGRILASLTGR